MSLYILYILRIFEFCENRMTEIIAYDIMLVDTMRFTKQICGIFLQKESEDY